MKRRLAAFLRSFGYLTLDPSARLRRLRQELEPSMVTGRPGMALPPLPDSAYPPGAVPLDTSGILLRRPAP